MKESPGDLVRVSMRAGAEASLGSSVMVKKALALVMKSGEEKFSMPLTTRWVGRMVMPGESMLTKVIIMAASGKAGAGSEEERMSPSAMTEGELSSSPGMGW